MPTSPLIQALPAVLSDSEISKRKRFIVLPVISDAEPTPITPPKIEISQEEFEKEQLKKLIQEKL